MYEIELSGLHFTCKLVHQKSFKTSSNSLLLSYFTISSFLQVLTAVFEDVTEAENEEFEVLVKLLEGVNSSTNLLDQQTLLISEEAIFNFAPIKSKAENLTIEVNALFDFPCETDTETF